MTAWHDDRSSAASRILPPLLLVAGIALAAWVVPALLKTADRERRDRVIDDASDRLASTSVLTEFNQAVRDIARVTEPSVVHVSVSTVAHGRLGDRDYTQSGSGWIWDDQGHIVTNAHVVDGAVELEIQLNDGSLRAAELVGLDLRTDIAVLKADSDGLRPAVRSPDMPEQGDMVFAFGSPFEFRFSMSAGIVGGIGRSAGLAEVEYESFIQVDAAINPGNSGGPLVNSQGKVIGMNTAIATVRGSTAGAGQFAGIGLAIPMHIVENVVDQIINHGYAAKGYLGVGVREVETSQSLSRIPGTPEVFLAVAKHFHGDGALVIRVAEGGPAQKVGVQVGDVITGIGGRRITRSEDVLSQVGTSRPGTRGPIEVWRGREDGESGEKLQLEAVLGTLDPTVAMAPWVEDLRRMGLSELSDARDPVRGVKVGKVDAKSAVAEALPSGSIITALDGQSVASVDDLIVRMVRGSPTRFQLVGPRSVSLTARLPNGTVRNVELPTRAGPAAP